MPWVSSVAPEVMEDGELTITVLDEYGLPTDVYVNEENLRDMVKAFGFTLEENSS